MTLILSLSSQEAKRENRLRHQYQFWRNDELTKWFCFKNELRELIGKTLQLAVAPKLDMSHRIITFTTYHTVCLL